MTQYEIPYNRAANRVVQFANNLNLVGDFWGTKCKLRPWQEEPLRRLFGSLDEDGNRLIDTAFLLLPRKHAKTYLTAVICLYALLTFGPNQVIISAAASQKQASRIFDAMSGIIRQDEYLSEILTIYKSGKIEFAETFSHYQTVTSSGGGNHGENCTVLVCDELHSWDKPVHLKTFEALTTGRGCRKNPLTIYISTQTSDPFSLAGQEFERAKRIKGRIVNGEVQADGEIENPHYLAVLYYLDADADWHDRELWKKVAPAAGDFVTWSEYERVYREAVEIPFRKPAFTVLYLNMPATSDDRWLDTDTVKACLGTVPDEQLKDAKVWCGYDHAPVKDLSCCALLFELEDKLYLRILSWCCEESIYERTRLEKVPYDQWKKDGWITATHGNTTDEPTIERDILAALKPYSVQAFAADKSYAIGLGQRLINAGVPVEWFIQGWKSFGPAVAAMEKAVISKKVIIEDNPVFRYCIHNTRMEIDAADNSKPSNALKKRIEKIDATVAAIMAFGRWNEDQIPEQESVYEKPGVQLWY